MRLNDIALRYFDKNILRLEDEEKAGYIKQLDNLRDTLWEKVKEQGKYKIIKFLKAGSMQKGTVLRPRDGFGVDADLAVYFSDEDLETYDLNNLHSQLRDLLIAIYPQKQPEDFEVNPRTLAITFLTSGLDVDLVPIIADGPDNYGWQPSAVGAPPLRTSVTGHIEFISRRAQEDSRYRAIVRILKRWRNHKELDALRSFHIELICAYLQDTKGAVPTIEDGLLRFFLYIAQTRLSLRLAFPENTDTSHLFPGDTVVILDPVNDTNNVACRITTDERDEIVSGATHAWEIITTANNKTFKGDTLELWKEVMGRAFVIEETT